MHEWLRRTCRIGHSHAAASRADTPPHMIRQELPACNSFPRHLRVAQTDSGFKRAKAHLAKPAVDADELLPGPGLIALITKYHIYADMGQLPAASCKRAGPTGQAQRDCGQLRGVRGCDACG